MNKPTASPKRFIAGARCPACEQLDKIQCWWEGRVYHSECVSCGYKEEMDSETQKNTGVQVIKLPGETD